jgi:hypothetical protein
MASHRIASFSIGGSTGYGAVVDDGIVDLSAHFAKDYPTLREVVAAGALTKLAEHAARRSPDHAVDAVTWLPPILSPEKIICIGVNYPACSCARRVPSSATRRRWCARAHRRNSITKANWF